MYKKGPYFPDKFTFVEINKLLTSQQVENTAALLGEAIKNKELPVYKLDNRLFVCKEIIIRKFPKLSVTYA